MDKSANANAERRALESASSAAIQGSEPGMAPLLKKLMAEYAATGLPPAYLANDADPESPS